MTGAMFRKYHKQPGVKSDPSTIDEPIVPVLTPLNLPQHSLMPDMHTLGDFSFTLWYLINSVIILAFQQINLYNVNWWLPSANHTYALDVKAIDPNLLAFIILILGYRFYNTLTDWACRRMPGLLISAAKWIYQSVYLTAMAYTFIRIMSDYEFNCWISLLIPLWLFLLLFGAHLSLWLFVTVPFWPIKHTDEEADIFYKLFCVGSKDRNHACSQSANGIRDEVAMLKSDFNYKLKRVYFESTISVYYSSVIPLVFCKNLSRIDIVWVLAFIMLSGVAMMLICFVQSVHAKYLDTLHKSALHLGHWRKHEERMIHIPHSVWSEFTIWPKGRYVKHAKGFFKAEGINNAAEPGNQMHSKFYLMFKQPKLVSALVSMLSLLVTCVIFLLLRKYRFWYQQFSLACLLLMTYYSLFVSLRDFMIFSKIYADEVENSD